MCRTVLHDNINGKPGSEKRGNMFPVTINLPRVAIRAMKRYPTDTESRINYFFVELKYLLLRTRKTCLYRYDILKNLKVKDLPFAIGQNLFMGSENLKDTDSIEPVLKNLTIAIGFFGLAETLVALTGYHHGQSDYAQELGLEIVQCIHAHTVAFTGRDHLNYSCYFTPAETCGYKMMKKDKEEFGELAGITDKEYYTNSIHIPVGFPISFSEKLKIEGEYHVYGTAGRIAYTELDDTPTQQVVQRIVDYTKNNTDIAYMGINFRIRYCKDCGCPMTGEMTRCPECGSKEIQGVSRVTGYLSLDERFGPGKDAERRDRVSHDDKSNNVYRDLYQNK